MRKTKEDTKAYWKQYYKKNRKKIMARRKERFDATGGQYASNQEYLRNYMREYMRKRRAKEKEGGLNSNE